MGNSKIFKLIPALAWALPIMAISVSTLHGGEWTTITSQRDVRAVRQINGSIFLATSGGLMRISDPNQAGVVYDNISGLGTNNITDLTIDQSQQIWVTGFGRLIKFDSAKSQQFIVSDIDGNLVPLYRVADDGDDLWLGSEQGLLLFSKSIDSGQIQDSYGLFGNLNPSPRVVDILLKQDSIFLGTSSGLAVAVRSDPVLLKSPSAWTTFDVSSNPELGNDTITSVVSFESLLYVSNPRGVYWLSVDSVLWDTTFLRMPIGSGVSSASLRLDNDSLFCYYNDTLGGGIAAIVGGVATDLSTAGLPSAPSTGINTGSIRWVGLSSGGVYHDGTGTFSEYVYTGPPGNMLSGVTALSDGTIIAGFQKDATARLDDSQWTPFSFWVRDGSIDVEVDSTDAVWVATVGNGLWRIQGDSIAHYINTNSSLRGTGSAPFDQRFVLVSAIDITSRYLFAACQQAFNGYPVAIADLNNLDSPFGWDSLGLQDGITDATVKSIDYHDGFLAVGTNDQGIFQCYIGGDPFDKSDDFCQHFQADGPSLLVSNTIRKVKYSPDGVLWAGTNFGLVRLNPAFERFESITLPAGIGPDITALEFDRRGNVWVGSINGLARIDATTGATEAFTTLQSDIVADKINGLNFDPFSGRLFVATDEGISIRRSEIGSPTSDVKQTIAFPNPFIIMGGGELVRFNYLNPARVTIYSTAGETVREMSVNQGWDGRNQAGNDAASGVYLFVLTDGAVEVGRGKILLVRQ